MTDILKKIKDWDFNSKDSSIMLNLDYTELPEITDIIERKVWLINEIDEYAISNVAYSILKYNSQDKGVAIEKRKPIYIYLSSLGGQTNAGLALVSAIQTSKTPVYTIVLGNAESMALIVAIVGHKRYCMPNAIYLLHDGVAGGLDSTAKARDIITFITGEQEDRIKEIILSHTSLTKKQYDDKYRKEWYFFPDIAKKYGFVDYIIGEDCELEEII